jgi:hypothetical protein
MQIPLWLFLASIFLAFSIQDMASLALRFSARSSTHIFSGLGVDIRNALPFASGSFSSSQYQSKQQPLQQKSNFSTTNTNMSTQQFMDAVRLRRSVYQLGKDIPVTDARIQELIKETILHVPSSFNTQTARVVLLVKEEHEKLWDMTKDILKAIVPADGWAATEGKLNMFKAAYGTVRPPQHFWFTPSPC